MIKTESYVKTNYLNEVVRGAVYYFGQLWNGNGDGQEILESGSIAMWDEKLEFDPYGDNWVTVDFEIVREAENILDTTVKVVNIG